MCFENIDIIFTFTNLRSREWKKTNSIKKEIRELVKNRADYIPVKNNTILKNDSVKPLNK